MQMEAAGHPFLSTRSCIPTPQGPSSSLLHPPHPPPKAVPWLPSGLRKCILVIRSVLRRVTQRRSPQGPGSRLRAVRAWTCEVLGSREWSRTPEEQVMLGTPLGSHGFLASEAPYRTRGPSSPGVRVTLDLTATPLLSSCLFSANHTPVSVN